MAPASNEEQFKFLISCIRHSNNGKVRHNLFVPHSLQAILTAIRSTLSMSLRSAILSAKAQRKSHSHFYFISSLDPKQSRSDHDRSAKRYERLMKFHGIHQSQSGGTAAPTMRDIPVASKRKASPSGGPTKKRKLDKLAQTSEDLNADDDEGLATVKPESITSIKAEPVSVKEEDIKKEFNATDDLSDSKAYVASNSPMRFNGAVDSAMFDDFLAFGGSFNHYHDFHAASNDAISSKRSASISMKPATQNGMGLGLHESILIPD